MNEPDFEDFIETFDEPIRKLLRCVNPHTLEIVISDPKGSFTIFQAYIEKENNRNIVLIFIPNDFKNTKAVEVNPNYANIVINKWLNQD